MRPSSRATISARSFGGRSDQVAAAHSFVRQAFGLVPVLGEAVLLTSEMCTNALQHSASGSGGTFTVTVIREMGRARIEVRDNGAAQAQQTQPRDESSERRRGLGLGEVLASRWGLPRQFARVDDFAEPLSSAHAAMTRRAGRPASRRPAECVPQEASVSLTRVVWPCQLRSRGLILLLSVRRQPCGPRLSSA